MADSVGASTSSTVTITVGMPLNGEIETSGDEDWYRVALTANVTYTIRLVGRGTGANTLEDPLIDGIYNSSGDWIGYFNNDGLISGPYGRDAMTTFRPTTSGNYWIAAMGDLGTIGTFTISVTNSSGTTDNVAATTATSGIVTVGGAINGTIDAAGDIDWYRVSLNGGATYTIRLLGLTTGVGTLADPVIAGVYNSSGVIIPNTYIDDFTTRDAVLTFAAPTTDNYYIAARGWSTYTGTFRLEVATAAQDVGSSTSTATALAIGSTATVSIGQPYDHDWYGVSLVAGTTYEFSLSGTGFDNTTPFIHGIFNSAGQYIGAYSGPILGVGAAAATTTFTPTTSGTYYIDAFSIYEGTYTLSAQQVTNDVPDNRNTTATVAVGGSVNGHIGGATDIDWYAVTLVGNTSYEIRMQGSQSGVGTLADPIIAGVYNASGVLQSSSFADDSDGNEAALIFRPTASGTYYIAADGYAGYTGTFRLSVATLAGEVGQDIANATTLTVNTPTTVTIDNPADTDWYKVDLTAGTTYGIRLMGASTNRGTLYDPVIAGVYDSSNTLVASTYVDDARGLLDPIFQFTPTTTGTYYIVTDGYDRFTGTARLAVTTDNVGTVNTGAPAVTVGTPTEGTIDAANDTDRYSVSLEANSTYYIRMLGYQSRSGDLTDPHINGIYFGTGTTNVGSEITDVAGTDVIIGKDAWYKVNTATAGGAGTYFIAATGNAGTDGAFLLRADKDILNTTAGAGTLTVGGSATSYIDESTDQDWFAVSLIGGESYVIKMQGSYSGNGTLIDPRINGVQLFTAPSTLTLQANTNTTAVDNADGRDSVVRLTAGTTGTYYINAQSSGSTVGTYRISVATEVGQNAATSEVLNIGSSVVGSIDDTTDVDWYAITVTANTAYVFKMRGVDGGGGTLDDPVITNIVNSGGTAQSGVTITAAGMDSYARWIPSASGTFYLNVTGAGTDSGTFTLSAATEVANTATGAPVLAIGGSVNGTIDAPGDPDWYSITVAANTAYIFKMEGADSGGGTLIGATITNIVNSAGTAQTGVTITTSGSDAYARWIPGTAGTYYINVTGAGSNMGTFRLSAATDVGNTSTSAASHTIGGSVNGAIDVAGDADWYSINVTANTAYIFKMEGAKGGVGTLDGAMIGSIVNSTGVAQTGVTVTTSGSDAYATWVPTATGTFYLNLTGVGDSMGTFRLSSGTEIGNTSTSAASHTLGGSVNGTIDVPGDSDWYSINVTANTAYVFKMQGLDSGFGTLAGATITNIVNSTGVAQAGVTTSTSGSDAYATWVPTAAGTYYINVTGSGTNVGTFRLSSSTEIGNTAASAASHTIGGSVNGTIDVAADTDWYSVTLTANTAYLFRVQGVDSGNGTLGAAAITGIFNSTGTAQTGVSIATSGSDAFATWTPTAGGTYYISVGGSGTSAGTFKLSSGTEAVGNTTASYSTINVGGTSSGTIDVPGDSDWYRVALANSTGYVFRISGVSSNGGTLADPNIVLRNSTGGVVAGVTTGEHGTDTTIRFTTGSTGAGNYFLDVQGSGAAGTYTLTAAVETGTTTGTAQAITLGTPFNGMIEDTSDADWFSVSLTANTSYTFKMEGVDSGVGTLGGAAINSILNSSGVAQTGVSIVTSGSDAYATWAPTTTGTYYINVAGAGTNIGSFRLTAATEAVGNTTTSYGTINVGSSASGTIDVPGDSDWYRVALANSTGYVFRVSGVSSNGGTLADPNIVLRNSTGAVVATGVTTGEHGTDTTIRFTTGSTGAGNYFLDVQGSGTAGTYTVTAALEPGTTSTSAGVITLNTPFTGMIEDTSDADWYGISLTANTAYTFKMEGVDSGGGTLGGAVITSIVNSSGVAQTGVSIVTSGSDAYASWTPTANGTYYINVTASGTNSGSFRLTAGTEAVGTTNASAASLPLTGSVIGTIDVPGDNDWYSVTLTANTPYIFRMQGADTGGGTINGAAITSILNSSGVAQTGVSTATSGSDGYASWTPTAGGTYYINVTGAGANTGTFRLSATTDAVGTTSASAASYTIGATANGTIDAPGDSDWYAVTVTANTAYLFKVQGADSGGGTLGGATINIVNASGVAQSGVVASTSGSDSFATWTSPGTAGTYYISVTGSGANSGTFRLTSGSEVGNTAASASTITVGGTVNGTADMPSDSDWYKFTHNSSTGYIVRISGVDGGGGTLTTPVINGVYTSGGVALTNEVFNTNGTDIIMRWSPTSATVPSDYFIDVGSGSSAGTYTVRLETEIGDTTAGAASTLTIGGSVTGTIDDSTDTDWYKVALTANTGYVFRISGGTVADPHIVLRDSSGAVVSTGVVTTENGTDTIVRFAVGGTGGTYYVDAQGGGSVGTYTLTAATDVGASTTTARALSIGTSAVGMIDDSSDSDWYSVSLASSTPYAFRIGGASSNSGTLADPHIVLRNSSGTVVTSGVTTIEDGTDTILLYTTSFSSGTWYIDVQGNGEDGTYTVTAALEPGNTTGSSEPLTVGTPIVGTIDSATDADWYSVALVANASYVFRMSGVSSNGGTLADPDVVLRTSTGLATGVVNSESGTDALVRFATGGSGATYYLAADGNGTTGAFTLSATREAGDTNATSMGITLGAGTPVYGSIDDATDVDRYSVSLAANTRYRVRMEGLDSGNGSLEDPWINGVRYSTNTTPLTNSTSESGGTGRDAYAIFTTGGTAGVHYIDADTSSGLTGTYRLTIELWP